MKNIKTALVLLSIPWFAMAQESATEKIQKTFHFNNPQSTHYIYVENIQGSVSIEGYDGSDVIVDVQKTIKARTTERVNRGMADMDLGIWQNGDSLAVYMKNKTYTQFAIHHGDVVYHYMDCNCDRGDRDIGYDPIFTFTVKVPRNSQLSAGTVNDGNLTIKGVSGIITAKNVNGAISIDQARQINKAITVNGDVDVVYDGQGIPGGDFRTINGDINLDFQRAPDAELSFKSMNGDLYTNVEQLALLKPEVTKLASTEDQSTTYKIERVTPVRLGKGGTRMFFETLNGDVIIKKEL